MSNLFDERRYYSEYNCEKDQPREMSAEMIVRSIQHAILNATLKHGEASANDIYRNPNLKFPDRYDRNGNGSIFTGLERAGLIKNSGRTTRADRLGSNSAKLFVWLPANRDEIKSWLESHPVQKTESPPEI